MELDRVVKEIDYNLGPLTQEQVQELRVAIAHYGLACIMDSAVRKEAEQVSLENNPDER